MSNGQTTLARRQEHPPTDRGKPKRELTKAEVEEQLRRRRDSMDGHLDGLGQEAQTTAQEAQQTAERTVQQYTLAVLGGLGVAGAALGYWLVRRRRKKREAAAARTPLDDYRDAVREEVRAAARRGDDPGEVAGRLLGNTRPLVMREGATPTESGGLLRTVLDLTGRTLVSVAVKYAVDAASGQVLPRSGAREVETSGEDVAPVAGAVSSQE
ncbi:MAG: hypothetical protein BRD48_04190 [Bacteroidetes bacterium QS_9_68_14]|nr:MAG: hypothetical protein BRD48_04190 [Bacteroidetes bacterium QS_9_68_14]